MEEKKEKTEKRKSLVSDKTRIKGFAVEIFRQVPINVKFLCALCCLILRNPVQTICGHRFCKTCFEYIINNNDGNAVCPSCEADDGVEEESLTLDKAFPDNAIRRELNVMEACCYYIGCSWTGRFQQYDEHESSCVKRPVQCKSCSLILAMDLLSDHETAHVQALERLCKFNCGQEVDQSSLEAMKAHMAQYGVEHLKHLFDRVQHLEQTLGMASPGNEASATAHPRQKPIFERIGEIEETARALQRSFVKDRGKDEEAPAEGGATGGNISPTATLVGAESLQKFMQAAGTSIPARVLQVVADLEEKMPVFEGVIVVLNREIEALSRENEVLKRAQSADREMIEALDRKMKTQERQLTVKDASIAELSLRMAALELTSYDGTLLWKIAEFSRRRQEAVSGRTPSIYSTPFYTSKTGYKMCARAYLNGDGMGKGTHVSLFFVLQRGEHDAILKWPFRQKVTLMFLDQNNREHVLDAFRPDPTSSSFKRPDKEMNIASGCPLFLSLSQLNNPAHGYVKDDAAFIKVIVSLDDL